MNAEQLEQLLAALRIFAARSERDAERAQKTARWFAEDLQRILESLERPVGDLEGQE